MAFDCDNLYGNELSQLLLDGPCRNPPPSWNLKNPPRSLQL